jgi:3-oxoacyl-[acyl-carrier-protein] synthase-3
MAARAARKALGDGPRPDLLINASLTPVQLAPDSSVHIQRALGWGHNGVPSYSVHATCLSFLVALNIAGHIASSGAHERIMIVSAERGTTCRDFKEAESASLIGDGAAAAIVEPTPAGEASEILAFEHVTLPRGAPFTEIRGFGDRKHPLDPDTTSDDYRFHMHGPKIFRLAVSPVLEVIRRVREKTGLSLDDIDVLVPHQASGRAVRAMHEKLGIAREKTVNIVAKYGNCIAASLPLALHEAVSTGMLRRGQTVLMLGTGAGLHVSAMLLRW